MKQQLPQSSVLASCQFPSNWTYCFHAQCPQTNKCLRFQSGLQLSNEVYQGYSVFPSVLSLPAWPYFKPIQTYRAAWGFQGLFQQVKEKDAPRLRARLKAYLGGNGTYYQYVHGQKLLNLRQQEWTLALFRQYGYTEISQFDHYKEVCNLD